MWRAAWHKRRDRDHKEQPLEALQLQDEPGNRLAACQGLGYYAAGFTMATNMAIMLSLVPLILSAVFLGERPSSLAVIGGVVSLSGIFVVLGQGDPSRLLSQGMGRGERSLSIDLSRAHL